MVSSALGKRQPNVAKDHGRVGVRADESTGSSRSRVRRRRIEFNFAITLVKHFGGQDPIDIFAAISNAFGKIGLFLYLQGS